MSDFADRKARRTSEALVYFFTHAEDLRRRLREQESRDAVDALLAAVRDDGDVEALVRRLHRRILAEGDAKGLHGGTRGPGAQLAGFAGAGREPGIYLCPHGRCLRHHWADDTPDAPPTCELDGTELRLKSL
ncbi:hypothetical protein [Streptomyces sp. NPDC050263]|uniref:hypothetical protein n=1 Tax=Streptomyces sp. NPDC050263 TaxID=3155037 RepID=UPI0034450ED1